MRTSSFRLRANCTGGNLIMDTTVFIEYLPSHKQWVLSTHIEDTASNLSLTFNSMACCLVGLGTVDCRVFGLGILEYVEMPLPHKTN